VGLGSTDAYYQEVRGRPDNTRRKPISAKDAHRCWTSAKVMFQHKKRARAPKNPGPGRFLLLSGSRHDVRGVPVRVHLDANLEFVLFQDHKPLQIAGDGLELCNYALQFVHFSPPL
jgi:hypothetical protein